MASAKHAPSTSKTTRRSVKGSRLSILFEPRCVGPPSQSPTSLSSCDPLEPGKLHCPFKSPHHGPAVPGAAAYAHEARLCGLCPPSSSLGRSFLADLQDKAHTEKKRAPCLITRLSPTPPLPVGAAPAAVDHVIGCSFLPQALWPRGEEEEESARGRSSVVKVVCFGGKARRDATIFLSLRLDGVSWTRG